MNPHTIPGPFATLEQIREYRSGDRVQCLLCGRWFRRLGYKHLDLHDTDADGYRERFGIPWEASLTSAASREASRLKVTAINLVNLRDNSGRSNRQAHRESCPAVKAQWRQHAELGRDVSARRHVTTPCTRCGVPLETTALTSMKPIYCDACASKDALKQRRSYQRRKAADLRNALKEAA